MSLREIGRELKVEALVWRGHEVGPPGADHRPADRPRTGTEAQIWAHSFERDLSDVLSLQNDIVSQITREIRIELTPREETHLAAARKVDPQAYEDILKGRFHFYKLTRADLDLARGYFESALQKDPSSALAYAGIAKVWAGYQQQGFAPATETTPRAAAAAAKTLELDEHARPRSITLGHYQDLGLLGLGGGDRVPQGHRPQPQLCRCAGLLFALPEHPGAPEGSDVRDRSRARAGPSQFGFQSPLRDGSDVRAPVRRLIVLLLGTLKDSPGDPVAMSTLRSAYHMKKMYPEALDIWKRSYSARGDTEAVEALDRGFREDGYRGALRRLAGTLVERSKATYVSPWQIGTLYTRAGDVDEALDWLEKSSQAHDQNMPYIGVDPIFDALKGDRRYQDLMGRMNLR